MSEFSSGLVRKVTAIKTASTNRQCCVCNGSGEIPVATIAGPRIKNLKITNQLSLMNDCNCCSGTGIINTTIKKIKKNPLSISI